jgi:hypothetical protein
MAKRSIEDIVRSLALNQHPATSALLNDLSRKLTEGKDCHAGQVRSRKQAFMMEVAGVLDVHRDDNAAALAQMG